MRLILTLLTLIGCAMAAVHQMHLTKIESKRMEMMRLGTWSSYLKTRNARRISIERTIYGAAHIAAQNVGGSPFWSAWRRRSHQFGGSDLKTIHFCCSRWTTTKTLSTSVTSPSEHRSRNSRWALWNEARGWKDLLYLISMYIRLPGICSALYRDVVSVKHCGFCDVSCF